MNARFNKCCYSNSSNIFSSLPCPEQLWSPPSFLPSAYQGLFPQG
jgi:hypothetical protein